MPQSSILGWLSKRSQSSEQPTEKQSKQTDRTELPRPPASLQEELPRQATGALQKEDGGLNSTNLNGSRQLHPNLELRPCTKEDIPRLKQLNSLLLPIPYPENFYRETIQDAAINNLTLLAVWHKDPTDPKIARKQKETLIGAIRCRILNEPSQAARTTQEGPMLYLSTLVLLSPFRGQGIATEMLDTITQRAVKDHGVSSVGAHVWEANADGLEWYRKRGFTELRREESYYPRLKPTAAVVMQRRIGVLDLVGKAGEALLT